MNGKSSYMLESLVNDNLLVYHWFTSKNDYPVVDTTQDNQQERLVLYVF